MVRFIRSSLSLQQRVYGMAQLELTDKEVRSALAALGIKDIPPITSTSRPFLLKKIQKLGSLETSSVDQDVSLSNKQEKSSSVLKDEATSRSHTSQQEDSSSIEGYYAVFFTESTASTESSLTQLPPFYTSKKEALKAIKSISGARVREFDTQEDVEKFLQEQKSGKSLEELQSKSEEKPLTSEKANDFPSLKTQDFNKLRIMIENGDLAAFIQTVWSNPRYLITSGDSPTVLKPPTWYNALHCAVLKGRLEFCQEIVKILQGDEFWKLVYPDDSEEIRANRKEHLLDLYLNMQDKTRWETPLHFASKLGHVDLVSFLLSFPNVSVDVHNKDEKTPADLVCERAVNAPQKIKQRIKELFNEPENFYVSVLRSVDNSSPPHLSSPCKLHEISPSLDKTGTPVVGHALAGPMSPTVAEQLYREWRSPSDSLERREATNIKRSDPDRGMERVGRQIAHKKGVGWAEYWDILGCSCDLSMVEGQQKLEEYLARYSSGSPQSNSTTVSQSFVESTSPQVSENEEDPLIVRVADTVSPVSSAMDDTSRQLFIDDKDEATTDENKKELNTNDLAQLLEDKLVLDTVETGDQVQEMEVTAEKVGSKIQESGITTSLDTKVFCTPVKMSAPNAAFLAGSLPTKLDYDVMLALGGCEPDPTQFPCICHWLELVNGYSVQEQASWRTPKKQWSLRSNFSHSISPLVISSPTSGSRHRQTFSPLVSASPTRAGSPASMNQTPVRSFHGIESASRRRTTPGYKSAASHSQSPLHNSRHEPRNTMTGQTNLASRFS